MRTKKYVTAAVTLTLVCATALSGCGFMNKNATLATMNEETITLGYGNFVAKYNQAMYDQTYIAYFGEDLWSQDLYGQGNTFQEDVKSNVLEQIENSYVLKAHASEYDIEVTAEEEKAIKQAARDFMENNSKEAIKQMGATEEYLIQLMTMETYAQKMQAAIEAEADTTVTREEAAQRTFSYVKFDTQSATDETGAQVVPSEEDIATLKTQADSLAASTDFTATANEVGGTILKYSYGADEDYSTMDKAVFDVADTLGEGQTSQVIEVADVGYYVIHLESAFDEEATQSKMESLAEQKKTDHYNAILDGWKKDDGWKLDEKQWEKVTFDKLFEAVQTDTEDTTGTTDTTDGTDDASAGDTDDGAVQ